MFLGKTKYQLPDLTYDFDALEPVISAEMMSLHYSKHHRAYVDNLNTALEKYHEAEAKNDLASMVCLQAAIQFNGGGHINHSIFWTNLGPPSKEADNVPQGELAKAIYRDFGSFDSFKEKFYLSAMGFQGSGWAWLGYHKTANVLELVCTANHDLITARGFAPIFTIDLWEHAYYLKYKNVRGDFIKAVWQILHWRNIEERFLEAIKQ
jgi:Fe-Mn family superoxide dismutase